MACLLILYARAGFTRCTVDISYERETKQLDGQVWADVQLEVFGLDVSTFH